MTPYSFCISRIWPQVGAGEEGGILISVSPTLLVGMVAQIFMLESPICLAEAGVVLGAKICIKSHKIQSLIMSISGSSASAYSLSSCILE